MGNCGAPDWTPYTDQEGQDTPGVVYPHSVWALAGITQVLERETTTTTEKTFYTVPAGKVFYLTSLWMTAYVNGPYYARQDVFLYNDSDVLQVEWNLRVGPSASTSQSVDLPVPVKALAGWYFTIAGAAATGGVAATITGYTLDA